ncbi:MAG: GGDEF domain-containing response regulator [Dehalococcoidia bacterium]|nr:GGDEF domain-containing response regulator [Dehalococcoidia bacterium]
MNPPPINIVLVEDNPGDARLISELLKDVKGGRYQLEHVDRLSSGAEHIRKGPVDVILLDLGLPDCSGLDGLTTVKGIAEQVPIVVLTGLDDEAVAVAAVQTGAQDYLVKGQVDGNLLWRSIRYAIERKQLEQRLAYVATHDTLTGLPNRFLLTDRLDIAITQAERTHEKLAMLMLDLDRFKTVNDRLGHTIGDRLLKQAGDRLTAVVRGYDTVARLGGDEFIILLTQIAGAADAAEIAGRIILSFREPFIIGSEEASVTASIGIAVFPDHGRNADNLLKNADAAMYRVKGSGRCNFAVCDTSE